MVLFGSNGRNARLIGTALLIVTFIVGALAGAAMFRAVSANDHPAARVERSGGSMRGGPRRLLLDDQFAKEIALTAEQRTKIKAILDRRDTEAKKMWDQFEPQLKAFGKQVHDEIEKVLTPEQQKKLDAAIEQRRKTARQRHSCAPGDSVQHKKD